MKESFDMTKTSVKAEFVIFGYDFDLDQATNVISIIPTETQKRGELSKNKNKKAEYTYWKISSGFGECLDISEQFNIIYSELKNKKIELTELKEQCKVEFKVNFVVHIMGGRTPGMHFNKELISFFDEIGAEVYIDSYVY